MELNLMRNCMVFIPFNLMGNDGSALACYEAYKSWRNLPLFSSWNMQYISLTSWKYLWNWRQSFGSLVCNISERYEKIIIVGGNHLLALPVYDFLSDQEHPFIALRLDAHTDVEENYTPDRMFTGNFMCEVDTDTSTILSLGPQMKCGRYTFEMQADHVDEGGSNVIPVLNTYFKNYDHETSTLLVDFDVDVFDRRDFQSSLSLTDSGIHAASLKKILSSLPPFNKKITVITELSAISMSLKKDLELLSQLIFAIIGD